MSAALSEDSRINCKLVRIRGPKWTASCLRPGCTYVSPEQYFASAYCAWRTHRCKPALVDLYCTTRQPLLEAHRAVYFGMPDGGPWREELDRWHEEESQLADSIFGGHFVRQHEIKAAELGRSIFNGCTDQYLREQYGIDRVTHVMGVGWFLDLPAFDG